MEVFHSLNASLMRVFGSDVSIVLTSMREKGESLMEEDRACRPSDPIFPIPGDECVPYCVGSCIIVQKQNPSTQDPISDPTAPSDFHLSHALKSALLGRPS
ncbi:hypothetical protein AVEN_182277-1 [Araneus ventricosus]|uniref:Uncharacterized protein n=1 Tax=Araneus ventricosus TaxID=182803 RepID=A0A4Y2AQH2_ARAVE|nr:hypothetical protein AVEN_91412-1 [Araneus ventricosus]GBL81446.1 hypothetical protein AVEN_110083-1 [Araneus ventricosus]GBL81450.1 hypothetical protein AVEN_163228-1 [Araneus ventricosus]GBL81455.1 hypothetical protein AVEN_182277-1 [Araneus ventricosus]